MTSRVLALLLILLAPAALAAEWTRYVNPRFGAGADVPPEHRAAGPAEMAGDGRVFRAGNGRSSVTVWGGPVSEGFSREVRARIAADEAAGWTITYRSEALDWAAWTGARSGQIVHTRTILSCGGRQTASVRIQYPAMDAGQFDAIAGRVGSSLRQDGACY